MITELIQKLKPFLVTENKNIAEKAGKAQYKLQAKAFFESKLKDFPSLPEEKKTKLINELKAVSPKVYIEYINLGLSDSSPYVRALTLKQVIEFRDPRFIEKVLPLINDPESFVRKIAYEFLSMFNIEKLAPILNKKLDQEKDPEALQTLIESIGNIGSPESLVPLTILLKKETNPKIIAKIVEALGNLKI